MDPRLPFPCEAAATRGCKRSSSDRRSVNFKVPCAENARSTMSQVSAVQPLRTVIPAEQIQKRVKEMARQISDEYKGQTIHALALLENSFIFMADLVRCLEVPVTCQFIKPKYRKTQDSSSGEILEIFF